MKLKDYWYTLSIILLVIIGYNFPETFSTVFGVKLNTFIKPVLQIIMLGMGATMTLEDFAEVFKSPKKVIIDWFVNLPLCLFWAWVYQKYLISRPK